MTEIARKRLNDSATAKFEMRNISAMRIRTQLTGPMKR